VGLDLPDFPWDQLTPFAAIAASHPEGAVNLSVGTPVDPTPVAIRRALVEAADSPGYPQVRGTEAVRSAIRDYLSRRWDADVHPEGVLPVVGTKELVAWLPTLLGLAPSDTVGFPALSYPTYEVGAILAGARTRRVEGLTGLGPEPLALLWINSPANPDGRVLSPEHLRKTVAWCRERGTVLASDECYGELAWDAPTHSILGRAISDGDHAGLLAVHSLSKRSNLAGYRAGFVAGDPEIVTRLTEVRKHAGMMVPGPVQAAMVVALSDEDHVGEQAERYRRRRSALLEALVDAGFRIDHSEGSLYLWATRDEPCWDTVRWLAERGVLVAPGDFYGPDGSHHVRVALTASDADVGRAVARITGAH
jgi:succinyldiaminopimelate transaminase